jgi:hypothetical protein
MSIEHQLLVIIARHDPHIWEIVNPHSEHRQRHHLGGVDVSPALNPQPEVPSSKLAGIGLARGLAELAVTGDALGQGGSRHMLSTIVDGCANEIPVFPWPIDLYRPQPPDRDEPKPILVSETLAWAAVALAAYGSRLGDRGGAFEEGSQVLAEAAVRLSSQQ